MATIIGVPLLKPRELNQGGTGTSELVFTSDGTLPVVLRLPTAEQLCSANGRGSRRIAVRAGGRVTGGTTTNYTPQLQFGTSATASSNTDLESGGAVAVNSVSGSWLIEWEGIIDATSSKLDGAGRHFVSGSTRTFTDWAVQDNAVSTADPDANGTLGFVVTGTFSGGHASNASYLDYFTLEVLD
jgi:hypothetical protein